MIQSSVVESITAGSSRDWMDRRQLALKRYLRKNHHRRDHERVLDLMYYAFPDEGKKLIQNDGMIPQQKLDMLIGWIVHSAQITCLMFGDQDMGKDATFCRLFELIVDYCEKNGSLPPRFVTLGNVKCPPFVREKDMYFNLKDIPSGSRFQPVYIYSSELDAEFPARNFQGEDNKMYAVLQNTFRHNHQKLFGCVKLSANVDISVLRTTNVKMFKYTSPEKLLIEGVERFNILSGLGQWFVPKDVNDKAQTLMAFDNNLLTGRFRLPTFWSDEYSEQFKQGTIPMKKIYSFIQSKFEGKETLPSPSMINSMQTLVFTKFREKVSASEIKNCFNFTPKSS